MPCIRSVRRGSSFQGTAQLRSGGWHLSSLTTGMQVAGCQLQGEPGGFRRPLRAPTSRRIARSGIRHQIGTRAPKKIREVGVLRPFVLMEAVAGAGRATENDGKRACLPLFNSEATEPTSGESSTMRDRAVFLPLGRCGTQLPEMDLPRATSGMMPHLTLGIFRRAGTTMASICIRCIVLRPCLWEPRGVRPARVI